MNRTALLAAGDTAVFAVFTTTGLLSHHDGFTVGHFARNFIPLTLCWFLVSFITETYTTGGPVRVGINWLVGVTAGVIVRKWWVGSPDGSQFWTFMAVAIITNGVFLLVWRGIASKIAPRPRASVAGGAREGEPV